MAESLEPEDPRQAGPYRLLGRLGSGGMGRVFLGISPGGRPVAVKVIRADMLAGNPEFRSRFAREVAVARRVNALFTAAVIDSDADGEMPWLATQYVAGPSLNDAVARHGPMPPHFLRLLAGALAEGLAAIHEAGVVHRDLKPSNVLLGSDGPRIIDFGISRVMEANSLTRSGMLVGTPEFMSPEQARDAEIGPPTDVFSLGSVLAFAATGKPPFSAKSTPALLLKIVNDQPVLDQVPPDIKLMVTRCLIKEPHQRPRPSEIVHELGPPRHFDDWLPQFVAEDLWQYRPQNSVGAWPGRTPTYKVTGLNQAGPRLRVGSELSDQSTVTHAGHAELRPDKSQRSSMGRPTASATGRVSARQVARQSSNRRRRRFSLIGAGFLAAILAATAFYIESPTLFNGAKAQSTPKPTAQSTSSNTSLMSIDGVKVNKSEFRLICDPYVTDVNQGEGAGCHQYTHQVSFGASVYIYLHFSGVTQTSLKQLCDRGYQSWLSDNEGRKASAQDYQLQWSQDRKYDRINSRGYWVPPAPDAHVPQSGGDVCYDIKGTNPEYWQPDHVIIYNVNGDYTALGPLAITWRLYNPRGRVILQTTWRTTMVH